MAHRLTLLERALKRFHLGLFYAWRHGRWPDLDHPRRFTEWVQWRKLNEPHSDHGTLTDKLESKRLASEVLGPDHVIPTVWEGEVLPDVPPASLPLVVKSNHGCNQIVICRTWEDWTEARRRSPGWLTRPYGGLLGEGAYAGARRRNLVEPYLGDPAWPLPHDYKVYVFGGVAEIVQFHVGRGADHRWTQFDRNWQPLSENPIAALAPSTLKQMLASAEQLAGARDFLRVDFYEVDGRLWFGEFCLYPGSGLDPFKPDALDFALGEKWRLARAGAAADSVMTEAA